MFRLNRLVWVVAVCMVVGAAYAAAVKVKGLTPVNDGVYESPDADGMAILNYHNGNNTTEITVAITDFVPDTDYHITVQPGIVDAPVVTNASGNANVHLPVFFDVCAIFQDVCVFVWRDDDSSGIRSLDEHRAEGCTPCP